MTVFRRDALGTPSSSGRGRTGGPAGKPRPPGRRPPRSPPTALRMEYRVTNDRTTLPDLQPAGDRRTHWKETGFSSAGVEKPFRCTMGRWLSPQMPKCPAYTGFPVGPWPAVPHPWRLTGVDRRRPGRCTMKVCRETPSDSSIPHSGKGSGSEQVTFSIESIFPNRPTLPALALDRCRR